MNSNELFSPARPLWDQDNMGQFVGRSEQMHAALEAVFMKGSTLFIHGERGIGKTSFAWHLREILENTGRRYGPLASTEFVRRFNIPKMEVLWLQCRSDMFSHAAVILELMKPGSGVNRTLLDACPAALSDWLRVESIDRTVKILGGFFSAETKTHKGKSAKDQFEERIVGLTDAQAQAKSLFFEMLSKVKKEIGQDKQIMIFLDEFDAIPDHEFFGRLIKECNDARFAFVGLTEYIEHLYNDHLSVARKFVKSTIEIPALSRSEVSDSLNNAESRAAAGGLTLTFKTEYRDALCDLCGGFPNLLQYMGFETVQVLQSQERLGAPMVADLQVFLSARERLYGPKTVAKDIRKLRNVIGNNLRRLRLLEVLSSLGFGMHDEQDFKQLLKPVEREGYDKNVRALIHESILKRHEERIGFKYPELNIVVNIAAEYKLSLAKVAAPRE